MNSLEANAHAETAASTVSVSIVDDDLSVLEVIEKVLVANGLRPKTYSNAEDFLADADPQAMGCVVTDLEMPGMGGGALQQRLNELGSNLAVVVITAHANVPKTIELMSQGAVTLLEKPFKASQLIAAINAAVEMSRKLTRRKQRIEHAVEMIGRLSDDEIAVMQLAAAGLPNKAISSKLNLSARTVDRRRQSALQKLDAASIAEFAILYATSRGEIDP